MTILATLNAIENASGRNDKERLLRKNMRTRHFQRVLRYALDPYMRFFVRKVDSLFSSLIRSSTADPHYKLAVSLGRRHRTMRPATLDHAFALLDELAARTYTGYRAQAECAHMVGRLSSDDAEVFQRILNKDLRCGVNTKTVNKVFPGLVPEFNVQLAAPYKAGYHEYPVFVEPKMDGMRLLAVCAEGEIEYLTRGGRALTTMTSLDPYIRQLLPRGGVLDGEITMGVFETTTSAIKRKHANEQTVKSVFLVFDHLTIEEFDKQHCSRSYTMRRRALLRIFQRLASPRVRLIRSTLVFDEKEVRREYREYRKRGREGIVIKPPNGRYEFRRTTDWMKMKPSDTIDVEITGWLEGKGRLKGTLGSFKFMHEGLECRTSGMTDKERREFWARRKHLVGTMMEVKFTEKTAKGRTRHARFMRLRSHKGERT